MQDENKKRRNKNTSIKFSNDIDSAVDDSDAEVILSLQEEINELKANYALKEFYAIMFAFIYIDIEFLLSADNWAAPAGIIILQIFFLLVYADKKDIRIVGNIYRYTINSIRKKT